MTGEILPFSALPPLYLLTVGVGIIAALYHTVTHHTWWESSGGEIGPSEKLF
jgi:hypothetical protein